jgi:hypothetical protein
MLPSGMDSVSCAAKSRCATFASSIRPLELARIDLELATEHYRFKNIAQKTHVGFAIYARAQDACHLRRVLEQREITAEILNL